MADFMTDVYCQTLLNISEVFIYKVPTLKTSQGHRAESWGLENPILTASMTLSREGDKIKIQLFSSKPDPDGIAESTKKFLFAEAPINMKEAEKQGKSMEHYVEAVIDSSRYYVIRCEDEKTRRSANIGVGFRERDNALDFKSTLDDYTKSISREKEAENLTAAHDDDATDEDSTPMPLGISNLTLKDGEQIKISINGMESSKKKEKKPSSFGGLRPPPSNGGGFLKPPPTFEETNASALKNKVSAEAEAAAAAAAAVEAESEDWGDFE